MSVVSAGHAMIAEYSLGDVAYISYTEVPVTRPSAHCLSFWYYMFRGHVGRLVVYLAVRGSGRRWRVWERQVSLGGTGISGRWLQAEIPVGVHHFPLTQVCTHTHTHTHAALTTIFPGELE